MHTTIVENFNIAKKIKKSSLYNKESTIINNLSLIIGETHSQNRRNTLTRQPSLSKLELPLSLSLSFNWSSPILRLSHTFANELWVHIYRHESRWKSVAASSSCSRHALLLSCNSLHAILYLIGLLIYSHFLADIVDFVLIILQLPFYQSTLMQLQYFKSQTHKWLYLLTLKTACSDTHDVVCNCNLIKDPLSVLL